jgi:hypothetical protein
MFSLKTINNSIQNAFENLFKTPQRRGAETQSKTLKERFSLFPTFSAPLRLGVEGF